MARYTKAMDPIEQFLVSGGEDTTPIDRAIVRLRNSTPTSSWSLDDANNTADALRHFLAVADQLPMDGVTWVRGENSPSPLQIAGVRISVRPDFILRFTSRTGEQRVGALKLHFIKGDAQALSEQGQEFVAAICHRWLLDNSQNRVPDKSHCFSLDLFRERLVRAPNAVVRTMNIVEASCAEYATAWAAQANAGS
ncbi:hypothetical protein [Caulifigura coniformis]|uniref:hypothetical protein n=1 Tax=Caulifigura coniformis TaxID=2527983 RepID=UPI001E566B0D|nr:hypothetical protein [Caulifigura coniformis]